MTAMNDDLLKKNLSRLAVPDPGATVRARALHRALTALHHAGSGRDADGPDESHSLFWRWAVALCVIGTGLTIFWTDGQPAPRQESFAMWESALHQMEVLFPGQLNAVIEQDGQIEIDLTAKPEPASEQPVMVEFSRGARVLRVLSYSGRHVCVNLGGTRTCFEVLVTGDGNVILTGDDFLWDSQNPTLRASYRVEARFLHPTS